MRQFALDFQTSSKIKEELFPIQKYFSFYTLVIDHEDSNHCLLTKGASEKVKTVVVWESEQMILSGNN